VRTHVGMYRIEGTVGRGGMGVVYRGLHERLNRQVAIKALAPELTQQPDFKTRFFSEACTQARLQHPNIVAVYDLIEDGGEFFIVMEYVPGSTLEAVLHETAGRGMELSRAFTLIGPVLTALDYAHSEAVIHRDVKPSNVLVTNGGRVKLMNFGIALLVGDKRLTSSQAMIGTPVYMSPEQILRPRQMDRRADIYSAAVMLFEMLAGEPPFDAETAYEIDKLQIEAPPPDLCERHPDLPRPLFQAIQRALAKNPDDRFGSAGEFLRALEGAAPAAFSGRAVLGAGNSAQTFVPTVVMPPPAGRSGVWIDIANALVVVVGAAVLAISLLRQGSAPPPADRAAATAGSPPAAPAATLARTQGNTPSTTPGAAGATNRSESQGVASNSTGGLPAPPFAGIAPPKTQRRPAAKSADTPARRSAATDSYVERSEAAHEAPRTTVNPIQKEAPVKEPTVRPPADAQSQELSGPKGETPALTPRPSPHIPTAVEAWAACQAKINSGKLDPWHSKEYLPKGMSDSRGSSIDLRLNAGGRSWLCRVQYSDGRMVALSITPDEPKG
jgi:hypothetical protein